MLTCAFVHVRGRVGIRVGEGVPNENMKSANNMNGCVDNMIIYVQVKNDTGAWVSCHVVHYAFIRYPLRSKDSAHDPSWTRSVPDMSSVFFCRFMQGGGGSVVVHSICLVVPFFSFVRSSISFYRDVFI